MKRAVTISGRVVLPGLDLSDHRSFWREGIPAVMGLEGVIRALADPRG